jgi:site-specific recombinase XerD
VNPLSDLLAEWELSLGEASRGTRIAYVRGVEQFAVWLAEHHPGVTAPDAITRVHVREWMASLDAAGKAASTRRVRLISLRLFLGYLVEEEEMDANPAAGVDLPKVIVQPVPVPRDADVTKLLATCGKSFRDRRDRLVIQLLFDCGMRRAELVGIDLDDVIVDERDSSVVTILLRKTKGGIARVVPLSSDTVLALTQYNNRARKRHPGADGTRALLLTERDRGTDYRLTGRGVYSVMTRRCAMAGVAPIRPHAARHGWVHDQLANGVGESAVVVLAGWTSSNMLQRYGSSLAAQRAIDASRAAARGNRF